MSKAKVAYTCVDCGGVSPKWSGQCGDCEAWNTLTEVAITAKTSTVRPSFEGYAGAALDEVLELSEVPVTQAMRISSGIAELDRVLGGGLILGSVILMGGDPGIGKSTVLLQMLSHVVKDYKALYITGEESLQQIRLRADRLGLPNLNVKVLAETQVENIFKKMNQEKPNIVIIDSIQTMYTEHLQSAPGSVSQVRESAAQLVKFAKQTETAMFLVGHVTKEGALAGPRVLEHMVDTVLYFEGQTDSRYRLIRAFKNRFGAVNELGIFAMTDRGLKEVNNPSAIFLSRSNEAPGSVVTVTWEGSRPLLIEVQALVDETHLSNPKRVTVGLDHNRLSLALAVLHRHCGVVTYDQDVFVNIVGGVRVTETATDLAMLLAVTSSLKNRVISNDTIVFGEVGLAGEVRPVQSGQERIKEAKKHGFKRAIVPYGNMPKVPIEGIEIIPVKHLRDAINHV